MYQDAVIRLAPTAFLAAPPTLSDRARAAIAEIRATRCFHAPGPEDGRAAHGRAGFRAGSHAPRHGHGHGHGNRRRGFPPGQAGQQTAAPRATRPLLFEGISKDRRCINDSVNKITPANFQSMSRRMRMVLDDDNVEYGVREIVDKACDQMDRCDVYVNLVLDVCEALSPAQRVLAHNIIRSRLVDSLDGDAAAFPPVDPARDYDEFCTVARLKRRAVGRCRAFCGFVRRIRGMFDRTPDEYYEHHEKLVFRFLDEESGAEVDVAASVETLLDCLKVILEHHRSLRARFRRAIGAVGASALPSPHCRFKIMDMMGK